MELVLATAHDHAVPMPLVSLIRDHLLEGIAAGYGELDWGGARARRPGRGRPADS